MLVCVLHRFMGQHFDIMSLDLLKAFLSPLCRIGILTLIGLSKLTEISFLSIIQPCGTCTGRLLCYVCPFSCTLQAFSGHHSVLIGPHGYGRRTVLKMAACACCRKVSASSAGRTSLHCTVVYIQRYCGVFG